jgi:hypothetical protein
MLIQQHFYQFPMLEECKPPSFFTNFLNIGACRVSTWPAVFTQKLHRFLTLPQRKKMLWTRQSWCNATNSLFSFNENLVGVLCPLKINICLNFKKMSFQTRETRVPDGSMKVPKEMFSVTREQIIFLFKTLNQIFVAPPRKVKFC